MRGLLDRLLGRDDRVDTCTECGEPTLPGAVRCPGCRG